MKRAALVIALLALCVSPSLAQYKDIIGQKSSTSGGTSFDIPRITVKGYLVDKTCAYRAANMDAVGATHTTECALAGATLGVIQHGVFYPFDEKGTKKALELLKKTKLTQGVIVQASGNMEGSAFVVSSLKEIKPQS